MRLVETYSQLNGLEYLQVKKPELWREVQQVVAKVDASCCKTKVSKEKTKQGKVQFCPRALKNLFKAELNGRGWKKSRSEYWVSKDPVLIRKTMAMDGAAQKLAIEASGQEAIKSYNQANFVKDRAAVEVQFGNDSFVAFDLFIKHAAFYTSDLIDLGIEILPMKELQKEMSSGPSYYEGELFKLIRHGRGNPAVPLVIIGIAP